MTLGSFVAAVWQLKIKSFRLYWTASISTSNEVKRRQNNKVYWSTITLMKTLKTEKLQIKIWFVSCLWLSPVFVLTTAAERLRVPELCTESKRESPNERWKVMLLKIVLTDYPWTTHRSFLNVSTWQKSFSTTVVSRVKAVNKPEKKPAPSLRWRSVTEQDGTAFC